MAIMIAAVMQGGVIWILCKVEGCFALNLGHLGDG